MLELDATVGGANANSYADVEQADAYHTTRLHNAVWTTATPENKAAALVWATRLLDENFNWFGFKATLDQSLRWPRYSVADRDGRMLSHTTIPQALVNATAELARSLLAADPADATGTEGFSRIKIAVVELEVNAADRAEVIPDEVQQTLTFLGVYQRVQRAGMAQAGIARR
jgi:hypothetical protein